jgi:LSD1 subclass zinc finger protein
MAPADAYAQAMALLVGPKPPAVRGPLAQVPREQRICHSCRRPLTVKGRGALRIHRSGSTYEPKYEITCGRCLSRDTARQRSRAFAEEREELFRRKMELLNQKARALGYARR